MTTPSTLLLIAAAFVATLTGCVTAGPQGGGYGTQPDHVGYVPARIAILPCRPWPDGARFADLPLSTLKPEEASALCTAFDAYVVKGFDEQPYMKAYSPKKVLDLLAAAKQAALPEQIPQLWLHQIGDCLTCTTPPAFYNTTIATRPAWLLWLTSLSTAARSADAVLLPFVTYGTERTYDDRGMTVAERAAGITLLLIDTNNGSLLWAGGREVAVPAKRLAGANVAGPLAPPAWSEAEARLYTDDLWRDFPGRQIY